jgi:hypothetical protein
VCLGVLLLGIADIVTDSVQTVLIIVSSIIASYVAWQIPTSVSPLIFVGLLVPSVSNGSL